MTVSSTARQRQRPRCGLQTALARRQPSAGTLPPATYARTRTHAHTRARIPRCSVSCSPWLVPWVCRVVLQAITAVLLGVLCLRSFLAHFGVRSPDTAGAVGQAADGQACPPELKVRTPAHAKHRGWCVEFESRVTQGAIGPHVVKSSRLWLVSILFQACAHQLL